jgi:hypothetical protein
MVMKQSGTFFVTGEKVVLKKDGTWVADGVEITHEQTQELFYRSIHWDSQEEKYCLKVGYETLFIEIEDTPYFVKAIERKGPEISAFLTNGARIEVAADHLHYSNNALYLSLEQNQRAKFLSAAYYEILKGLEEDKANYFLTIAGQKAILAKKDEKTALRPSSLKQSKESS